MYPSCTKFVRMRSLKAIPMSNSGSMTKDNAMNKKEQYASRRTKLLFKIVFRVKGGMSDE